MGAERVFIFNRTKARPLLALTLTLTLTLTPTLTLTLTPIPTPTLTPTPTPTPTHNPSLFNRASRARSSWRASTAPASRPSTTSPCSPPSRGSTSSWTHCPAARASRCRPRRLRSSANPSPSPSPDPSPSTNPNFEPNPDPNPNPNPNPNAGCAPQPLQADLSRGRLHPAPHRLRLAGARGGLPRRRGRRDALRARVRHTYYGYTYTAVLTTAVLTTALLAMALLAMAMLTPAMLSPCRDALRRSLATPLTGAPSARSGPASPHRAARSRPRYCRSSSARLAHTPRRRRWSLATSRPTP